MFGPVGSQQLTRQHWGPLNAGTDDVATGKATQGVKVWRGRMPLTQKYLIFFYYPTNQNLFH